MISLFNIFNFILLALISYILAKYTYVASRFYPYFYKNIADKQGYFEVIWIEIKLFFVIFRSLGKLKISKRKYLDLFLFYLIFFICVYYKLNLNIFYMTIFSILFLATMIDLKTKMIPDSYLIIAAVFLIISNVYEGNFENIKYFFITVVISYIILIFQILLIRTILIGIQDIKLYGFYFLIFGTNLGDFWDVLYISSMIGLFFSLYFSIRYKTKLFPFGLSIIIAFLLKFYFKDINVYF